MTGHRSTRREEWIRVKSEVRNDLMERTFEYPGKEKGQARGPVPTGFLSLPDVIERFKSLTTTRHIEGVKNAGWLSFPGKLWQRSCHNCIIRNEIELTKFRTYICNNPAGWDTDENNLNGSLKTEQANPEGPRTSAALIRGVSE